MQSRGIEAVRIARAEGVPVVFGTDLLGRLGGWRVHLSAHDAVTAIDNQRPSFPNLVPEPY